MPSDSRRTGHERVTGGSKPDRYLAVMDGDDGGAVWTDRCCLQQVQYGTEANLARRVVTAARDAAARAD